MNCLINILALCVFDPSNVYLTAGMQSAIQKPVHEGNWCLNRWCSGPMGEVRLGVKTPLSRSMSIDYGILHTSYVNTTRDRGVESMFVTVTWRPFP